MKKVIAVMFAIICFSTMAEIPEHKSNSYVNDFANVMDENQRNTLDQKIRAFKAQSSIEMTIVTIASLDGGDVDTYSHELFQKWGIGSKELNNGILMLISVADHKWRIEVGKGLEEYLTDGTAAVKAQSDLVPLLRKKDFFGGFTALTDDIIQCLGPIAWQQRLDKTRKAKEDQARAAEDFNNSVVSFFSWTAVIVAAGAIILVLVLNERKKKRKIEEERLEKKRILDNLISDNNAAINEFQKLHAWAKANVENPRIKGLPRCIDGDIKKINDLLTQRTLTIEYMESEKILIRNIIQPFVEPTRAIYNKFAEFNTLKDTITGYSGVLNNLATRVQSVSSTYSKMLSQYGSVVIELACPERMFLDKIQMSNVALKKLQDGLAGKTMDDYEVLGKDFAKIEAVTGDVGGHLNVINVRLKRVQDAVDYVSTNRGTVNSLLSEVQRKVSDSDVSSSTRVKFNAVKTKAEMYNESKNPLIAYNDLNTLISDLNSVKRSANNDIEEEKRRRRRIEEEAAAVAAAVITSSSSSYTSSSTDTSSGFGGGSSNGGGASGDW
jgi:uncharacterized membrane protein YgcG